MKKFLVVLLTILALLSFGKVITLKFFYPVGVAGPLARVIDEMVKEFNKEHPNIKVEPVYCGNYDQTMQKVQTAVLSGNPPDVAVIEISELFTLVNMDAIIPLDEYVEKEGGKKFLEQYYEAFLGNSYAKGKIWAIPFQRSTIVFYWNKDLFKKHAKELEAVGLDPNRAPRTWYELVKYAQILTERKGNEVLVHGLILPGGWNDWIFEAFIYQNGSYLISPDAKRANYNSLEALEVLQLWHELTNVYKVNPPLRPWNTTPIDFAAGRVAMMYYSTGGLPLILKTANFEVGVSFLPMHVQYGTPVGGGNFFIFKGIPKEHQDAAWEFIKWMTSPYWAAYWSIKSGYVCVNKKGYDEEIMKEHLKKYPQYLVARDQLQFAHSKIMAPEFQRIRKIMVTNLDAVMLGRKSPKDAVETMQREIQAVLDRYSK